MMAIAALWIGVLLLGGGFALDRTLVRLVEDNFDEQLEYVQTALITSAEIDSFGDVQLYRSLGDQRFLEPNSGVYWQITGEGHQPFPSRSLWDRSLTVEGDHIDNEPHFYNSDQFENEPLRIVERTVILPTARTGLPIRFRSKSSRWSMRSTRCSRIPNSRRRKRGCTRAISRMRSRPR